MFDTLTHAILLILCSSVVRYFVVAGIPFLLFYVLLPKKTQHLKIQQKKATRSDFGREILHSLQSTLIFVVIATVLLFTPLRQFTRIYDHVSDYPVWYMTVSVILALLIHDAYFYWMHRVLHHPKLFNITHLLHHKSTNPSPWTSYSFHFLEGITEGLVIFIIAFIIPIHPAGIALFMLSSFVINVYGHLGYEIMPKRFRYSILFGIINTSIYHNLHHSKFKGNYGLYLRFWDRLMKTEHPDYEKEYDKVQEQRFGEVVTKIRKTP